MILLITFFIFFAIYSAVVRATHLKFKNNGIGFNFKYKLLVVLLPLLILLVHFKLALKFFPSDKKRSLQIVAIAFVKYPIILGNLIEVILESMAECRVFGSSKYLKMKNKKQVEKKNKINLDTVSLRIREIIDFLKRDSNYERELLSGISY